MGPIQEAAKQLSSGSKCVTKSDLALFPDVRIELEGNVALTVPPTTYFQPSGSGSGCFNVYIGKTDQPPNILGQPLMEAYYTVFDKGSKRIGFAPIAGC